MAKLKMKHLIPLCVATAGLSASACRTTNPDSTSKFVGGSPVGDSSWEAKHTVVLFTGSGEQLCTATRIGPNVLVTAGHCVQNPIPDMKIGYGGAKRGSSAGLVDGGVVDPVTNEKAPVVAPSAKVLAMIPDPNFAMKLPNGDSNDHDDIGIVIFEGDLPVDVTPVASFQDFPRLDNQLAAAKVKTLVKAGYGKKNDDDTSNPSLDAGPLLVAHLYPDNRELEFQRHTKTGTCSGDSGGPAYIAPAASPIPKLVGVTSRGPDDDDGLDPEGSDCNGGNGVDTDARYYRAWLQGTAAKAVANFNAQGHNIQGLSLSVESADTSATLVDNTVIDSLTDATARVKAKCEQDGTRSYDQVEGRCSRKKPAAPAAPADPAAAASPVTP